MNRARPGLVLLAAMVLSCQGGARSASDPFHVPDSLLVNGRFAAALPVFAALRDSLLRSGDSSELWRAQAGWAEALFRTGRLDSGRLALDDARTLAGADRQRAARTRYLRSMLLHRQGKLDSALGEAAGALAAAHALGDRELEVDAHSAYATVFSLSGRYREAVVYAESALAGERQLRRPATHMALRLNNLAIEYRHLGRLAEAERALLEGLEIARTLPSPRMTMLMSGNMANLRHSAGNIGEALRYAEANVAAAETLHDVQGLAVGNSDIGDIHLATGNYPASRIHYERSLAANTPTRYAYGRIQALTGLGQLEIVEGRPAQAPALLRQAMAAADSGGGFGQQRVLVRSSLSRAAVAAGDGALGLRWANAALAVSDSVGDLEARLDALEARAAALERLRRREAAAGYLEAIDLLESWRGRIALGDLRLGVAEPHWVIYEGAIRTLIARGDPAAAFAVAERARARMLLELMAERDASRPAVSPLRALRARLRVLVQERDGARSDALRGARDREIAAVIDSLGTLEREDRDRDAGGAARFPSPVPLDTLREALLAPGRVLLSYFWGERDVYGWRAGRDGISAVRLGSADSLGALVEFLRAAVEAPGGQADWVGPARRAWTALIGPLDPGAAEQLLIVPDGPLAHLPFEILIAPGDSAPLGASRRLSYGPSASVLLALARRRPAGTRSRALLAVGNPAGTAPAPAPSVARAGSLRPLPFAESEARAVYDLYRSAGADLLTGRQATRLRWLALQPARYRYLHFAAHAEVNDRRPELTRVLLAGDVLDLPAIRGLELRADLVTLSACETALGQRVRGEGVIGLPHAFLAAGAGAVLVTLWRVDDRATAAFMEEFYRELHAGRGPAEALRRVRQRRAASGSREHPAYWAPFVLVGVS